MSVVSRGRRRKSWQIADEVATLLDSVCVDREQFAAKLRALARAHPDVSSDEDAARLIGCSYRQYQRWLSGDSDPRSSSLKQIAAAYEIPVAELLGEPDRSQLDRIEDMLKQLLGEPTITPEEEAAQTIEAVDRELDEAPDADQPPGEGTPRNGAAGRAKPRRPGDGPRGR